MKNKTAFVQALHGPKFHDRQMVALGMGQGVLEVKMPPDFGDLVAESRLGPNPISLYSRV